MSTGRVIVVCGFGRSGTSLMMQMLSAAGVRCCGEWPAFEPIELNPTIAEIPFEFVEGMKGGALKLLDPHRVALPAGFAYDFIWMRRDYAQQARSFFKMLGVMFPGMGKDTLSNRQRMARGLAQDEPRAKRILQAHAGHRFHEVKFEDLLERSEMTVAAVAQMLGLAFEPMYGCIIPRSSECYDGLLELELLNREREAGSGLRSDFRLPTSDFGKGGQP